MRALAAASACVMAACASGTGSRPLPQDASPVAETTAPPDEEPSRWAEFFDDEDGYFDVSKLIAKGVGFIPIVSIVTEPAIGYGLDGDDRERVVQAAKRAQLHDRVVRPGSHGEVFAVLCIAPARAEIILNG